MGTIEFWIGRAGSGKSHQIAREIEAEVHKAPIGRPIYWMVPDEIAYFTERRLLASVPSVLRAEVITLSRFSARAVQAVRPNAPASITQTGKRLLLAAVYSQYVPLLGPLRRERPTPAFFDTILDAFDEMTREMVDLAQLEGAIQTAAASLTQSSSNPISKHNTAGYSLLGKLRDLSLLYIHYRKALDDAELRDSTWLPSEASLLMEQWAQLQDAVLYVDGFSIMTPQERGLLLSVSQFARRTVITLPIDATWLDALPSTSNELNGQHLPPILSLLAGVPKSQELFAPQSLQTLLDLCREAQVTGVVHQIVAFPGNPRGALNEDTKYERFAGESELQHLEQRIFSNVPALLPVPHQSLNSPFTARIRRFEATNPQEECLGIAADIKQRGVCDKQAYQTMAVVVPNLSTYTPYLREAFELFQIPASLEPFPPLAAYPLSKFLLACLSAVEAEASTDAMVRILKTDFSLLSQDDADWLEGYLRLFEVAHLRSWFASDAWTFAEDAATDERRTKRAVVDDNRANRLRGRILEYFAPFADVAIRLENTPLSLVTAIWTLFEAVNAKAIVARWMVNEDAEQHPLDASQHEQAWQKIMALCNDLSGVLPNVQLSRTDLFSIIRGDLERQTLATIPLGIDEVRVTDVARAHSWDAAHVYVAGLTDKEFPRRIRAQGLLQDEERMMFLRLFGQPLGLTSGELQQAQRTQVYFALTRARETLTLSAPMTTSDGREAHPSMILQRVEMLFPEGPWREGKWGFGGSTEVTLTQEAAIDRFLLELHHVQQGNTAPLLRPLLDAFREKHNTVKFLEKAVAGFFHQHVLTPLPRLVAKALYGDPLMMNVYQLESFASCPFQHFAQFGLRVKPVETRLIPSTLAGTLRHDVLMSFVQSFQSRPQAWKLLTDEEAISALDVQFEKVLSAKHALVWQREEIRKTYAESIRHELHQVAVVLTRNARYGQFDPVQVELSFGLDDAGSLPAFEIELEGGGNVGLRGRVDRVDAFTTEDAQHFFRIVDYKSRSKKLNLTHVAHGLQMQLPVYASVIEAYSERLLGHKSQAAGLLYIPVMNALELQLTPADEEKAAQAAYEKVRAGGWLKADSRLIHAMDSRLTDGESSELFPKVYNKDQSFSKSAPVLTEAMWQAVQNQALRNVKRLATEVLHGEKAVAPYQLSPKDTACHTCLYTALCHMDAAVDGERFRRLEKQSKDTVEQNFAQSRPLVSIVPLSTVPSEESNLSTDEEVSV